MMPKMPLKKWIKRKYMADRFMLNKLLNPDMKHRT